MNKSSINARSTNNAGRKCWSYPDAGARRWAADGFLLGTLECDGRNSNSSTRWEHVYQLEKRDENKIDK